MHVPEGCCPLQDGALAAIALCAADAWGRMLGFMPMCMNVPEGCCPLQDGALAAIALCAADAQELEALGAAELCRGAEVAQQSAANGPMSPAAVEAVECLGCPRLSCQHNS